MTTTTTVRGRPLLLDEILSAAFGAALGRTLVTATLDLNPGLAALGAALPVGTVVTLPDAPTPALRAAVRPVVSLYG